MVQKRGTQIVTGRLPELRRQSCESGETKAAGVHRTEYLRKTQTSAECPL